ncbi:MAG: hypothetical protein DRG78_00115 [Epsilonproteobacteria bacterium]|nr:MAG: hypothetical protein DRG78_00115 [Campylobacterota bacterium]
MRKQSMNLLLFISSLLLVGCVPTSQKNNAPKVELSFASITINEDSGESTYQFKLSDADGDNLSVDISSSNDSMIQVSEFSNYVTQAEYTEQLLSFKLKTINNMFGVSSLKITASDGDANSSISFMVTIINIPEIFASAESWNGHVYNIVTSPYTNKDWLDRNLGATRVCNDVQDSECGGSAFQWGRGNDSHELINSDTTDIVINNLYNTNNKFIVDSEDWLNMDTNGSIRMSTWSKIDGTSICPIGFRVPTIEELGNELLNMGPNLDNDGFTSFLKLGITNPRAYNGDYDMAPSWLNLWSSSSSDGYNAKYLQWNGDTKYLDRNEYKSYGCQIRCIKN